MNKKIHVIVHTPDNAVGQTHVIGGPISDATPEGVAVMMNSLATEGTSEAYWAASPIYWQRKLARALAFGFFAGVVLGAAIARLI